MTGRYTWPAATIAIAGAVSMVACADGQNPTTPVPTASPEPIDHGGGGTMLPGPTCTDGPSCSLDLHDVVDCDGKVLKSCSGTLACDPTTLECSDACEVAAKTKRSVGCEYYATFMDTIEHNACFAAFVANTWTTPARVSVEWGDDPIDGSTIAYRPVSQGLGNMVYEPLDLEAGIPPGEVAILFLAGPDGVAGGPIPVCPKPSAVYTGALLADQSGIGKSFRISSDVPVVSFQISPYGGGSAAVTGASLLIPTSAWGTNYITVNAAEADVATPSMNIVAMDDDTTVTLVPKSAVVGGGGIPSGPAGEPLTFMLNRGEHAQLTQVAELTGSVLESDKPVGLMGGHRCMRVPAGTPACDHGEQMIPAVQALGHEYVGVMHEPRVDEPGIFRIVGVVDGTQLQYSTPVGGPANLAQGQSAWFVTDEPFVVSSQDAAHPFLFFSYMSSSAWQPGMAGSGDPDFVLGVPPDQFLDRYVFFTDPTYPETSLVIVRSKRDEQFMDVELDCAGKIEGWAAVGPYEWTRVRLSTGSFENVGGCSNGRHEIKSDAPFGVWAWGWSPALPGKFYSGDVSYGYPVGMSVRPINEVVIPVPR